MARCVMRALVASDVRRFLSEDMLIPAYYAGRRELA
jgi:hypothetical protein